MHASPPTRSGTLSARYIVAMCGRVIQSHTPIYLPFSTAWTYVIAASITIRHIGMVRRAKSYWSFDATTTLANYLSIRCAGG